MKTENDNIYMWLTKGKSQISISQYKVHLVPDSQEVCDKAYDRFLVATIYRILRNCNLRHGRTLSDAPRQMYDLVVLVNPNCGRLAESKQSGKAQYNLKKAKQQKGIMFNWNHIWKGDVNLRAM